MKKVRDISNEEYEEALNDLNIIKISKHVANKFKNNIDECELNQLVNIAIWKALSCYTGAKNTSFLSYVYKYVTWECKTYIREKKRLIKTSPFIEKTVEYKTEFFDILDNLCDTEALMVKQRYLENMTYREIGERHGFSRSVAKIKIDKIISKLKLKV